MGCASSAPRTPAREDGAGKAAPERPPSVQEVKARAPGACGRLADHGGCLLTLWVLPRRQAPALASAEPTAAPAATTSKPMPKRLRTLPPCPPFFEATLETLRELNLTEADARLGAPLAPTPKISGLGRRAARFRTEFPPLILCRLHYVHRLLSVLACGWLVFWCVRWRCPSNGSGNR